MPSSLLPSPHAGPLPLNFQVPKLLRIKCPFFLSYPVSGIFCQHKTDLTQEKTSSSWNTGLGIRKKGSIYF
jgi:hypothetical protein